MDLTKDADHVSTVPQYVGRAVSIAPKKLKLIVEDLNIKVGEKAVISPKIEANELDAKIPVKYTFKLVSVKKGKKNYKKTFSIDLKTGKVTVRKGLKKGTYKVKVRIKAEGNANYRASAWKAVTFKVRVR